MCRQKYCILKVDQNDVYSRNITCLTYLTSACYHCFTSYSKFLFIFDHSFRYFPDMICIRKLLTTVHANLIIHLYRYSVYKLKVTICNSQLLKLFKKNFSYLLYSYLWIFYYRTISNIYILNIKIFINNY